MTSLLENALVVHIYAGDREVGFWVLRLFLNTHDFFAVDLRYTKSFCILHLFQKDLCSFRLALELVHRFADRTFDQVVTQNDTDLLTIGEVLSESKRVRNTAFAFLISVVNVLQSELFAIRK